MVRERVFNDFLVRLDLVSVVDNDVELTETSVVNQRRRPNIRTVLDVPVPINVGDRLTESRVPEQFHGVCYDGFVGVGVPLATSY